MRPRFSATVSLLTWTCAVAVSAQLTACSGSGDPARPPETTPPVQAQVAALTATSLAGAVGENVTPVPQVRVTNQFGTPLSGVKVLFRLSDAGSIANDSATTDAQGLVSVGRWTLGMLVGTETLTASTGNIAVSFTANAEAGPAAQMRLADGDLQRARAGTTLSNPLRVRIVDRFGNPVRRQYVNFDVISGNGAVARRTGESDASGIASSGAWTLGGTPGAQKVKAQVVSAVANPIVEFTAIACPSECQQQQLLFVANGAIYQRDLFGSAERLLAGGERNERPVWSPDGQQIAFVRRDSNWVGSIYVMQADGSKLREIASDFDAPAWSPDGRHLVASRNSDDGIGCTYTCDLYLIRVDGSAKPQFIATMGTDASWSPDGRRIAFVSLSGDDGYHSLNVVNPDGSGLTEIISRDPGGINHPTWSPDGRRIAFSKCIDGGCNLYVVNADGSQLTSLLTKPAWPADSAWWPADAAWSPDGAWIAFSIHEHSYVTGVSTTHIAIVPADHGGEAFPLIMRGGSPAWRP